MDGLGHLAGVLARLNVIPVANKIGALAAQSEGGGLRGMGVPAHVFEDGGAERRRTGESHGPLDPAGRRKWAISIRNGYNTIYK
jgi:hypothetical protein